MRYQKSTQPIWIILRLVLIVLSPMMAMPVSAAEDFAIVVLPDTQVYSQRYPEIFAAQTQWIADNKETLNVVYVAHEGDIVNDWTSTEEWDNAEEAMKLIDGTVTIFERRIASSSDDAEELDDGSMYLNSSDLEFMKDPSFGEQRAVGMRWTNVNIPPGATITKAYIDEVASINARCQPLWGSR